MNRFGGNRPAHLKGGGKSRPKKEPEQLFQKKFKSVGPRTYEAEVMRAGNGNHYIVMSEGKPDDSSGEMRKTRLFVFSEDFEEFWNLMRDVARFVKDNPIPADVRQKRENYWKSDKAGNGRG